jgi:hypothetical protein
MSRKAESAEINSQHVPLRQTAEEKGRGKGLELLAPKNKVLIITKTRFYIQVLRVHTCLDPQQTK